MFMTHKSLETSVICLLNKLKLNVELPCFSDTRWSLGVRGGSLAMLEDRRGRS